MRTSPGLKPIWNVNWYWKKFLKSKTSVLPGFCIPVSDSPDCWYNGFWKYFHSSLSVHWNRTYILLLPYSDRHNKNDRTHNFRFRRKAVRTDWQKWHIPGDLRSKLSYGHPGYWHKYPRKYVNACWNHESVSEKLRICCIHYSASPPPDSYNSLKNSIVSFQILPTGWQYNSGYGPI